MSMAVHVLDNSKSDYDLKRDNKITDKAKERRPKTATREARKVVNIAISRTGSTQSPARLSQVGEITLDDS